MEIIQQKLIWLLGCASLIAVLLKLDTGRYIAKKTASIRLMGGLILILSGTIIGIMTHAGLLGDWIHRSGLAYYVESILGYIVGWSLLVWGILDWARENFDGHGRPLLHGRYRIFSEKVSEALVKSQSSGAFLEEIAPYLLAALDCRALTFHTRENGGSLRLNFHDGLTPRGAEQIFEPASQSIFHSALADNRPSIFAVASEDMPETSSGPVREALCCPLSAGEDIAVMTLYSAKPIAPGRDDFSFIDSVTGALLPIIKGERLEAELLARAGLDDVRSAISRAFRESDSIISALLRSAKVIYEYLPFREINFYTLSDGKARVLDFPLPDGGRVNIIDGYLKKTEYPFLYIERAAGTTVPRRSRSNFIRGLKAGSSWIEILPQSSRKPAANLTALLETLADNMNSRLGDESAESRSYKNRQRLAALGYCLENGLAADDMTSFLREAAQVVIDTEIAAFCRITLCDPGRTTLKTAALAQARSLRWPMSQISSIPLEKTELHRKALQEKTLVKFDQNGPSLSDQEKSFLLPENVKFGTIVPLTIAGQTVGLLTYGEIRNRGRVGSIDSGDLFVSTLAAVISLVLTRQRDRKLTERPIEGPRKLKFQKPQPHVRPVHPSVQGSAPGLRSRLNGPLAGILASCEYLRDDSSNTSGEVGRFLGIIERNAMKIQDIAAGLAVDNKQRG